MTSSPLPSPTDAADELRIVRQRLQWGALALVAAVTLVLVGESVARSDPMTLVGNVLLWSGSAATAAVVHRTRWSTRTMYALGAGLALLTLAVTLSAFAARPELRFLVMLIAQLFGAGLLFFSTAWLIAYLSIATVAATWTALVYRGPHEATLVAACAVLALTVHVALRERQRRSERGHAAALAAALALARRELEDKERAERERAAAEKAREELQLQLHQAQKMEAIGTLAGGVAHDMNNALAAIIGFADCIASDSDDPKAREDAEQILLAANRAADLTRNLLGFGRRGQFRRVATRPESLLTSLATLLARTLPKSIRIETSFADRLAAFEVDSGALTHALVNLGINAADAMNGHGVLTLAARVEEVDLARARTLELAPGPHVVLTVRDTGHGMDDEVKARIFEPFFTTKAQGRGTGLGLAMVYGTIKRHEGAITVTSAPGRGTTFELYVRAAGEAAAVATVDPRSSTEIPLHGVGRILVIDDEEMVRTVMIRTLERAGYQVAVAVHGQAGLDALAAAERAPDLVILDMAMPVMAGPETFRRARQRDPSLRVLLVSGFTSADDARSLLEEGALGLVEKPFTPGKLLTAVERAIRGRRLVRDSGEAA